ncbi:glycosyltransferase family 4 protein [Paenibacillus alkalitolerans]|uniref:glycosyltransferase family 4 protein n=1 Tax=Paenibacillus alkalitolerans TaxID=2799335 RepID=UPI0018F51DBA|nr:glycosyltransferase family 1 protein [Paenibacillus alkalitolerans]
MRIGFDISQTAEKKAGCGFFADQIITNLIEIDKENQYLLYPVFYGYRHPNFKQSFQSKQKNVQMLFHDLSWEQANELWNNNNIQRDHLLGFPDIVHSNNYSCPNDVKAKKIVTIYDTTYLDYPDFTTEENRLTCFDGAFESSIYADHIITISNFSKNSILKYFPYYPEERVSVVYLGSRPSLSISLNQHKIRKIKNKLGISNEFWLGVGTIEPRKNYRLLLEAFAKLVHNAGETRDLYIAGDRGWLENDIDRMVNILGLEKRVRFLGYVTDEELAVLYSSCYAFIYPSHFEGFGLPVLEAISCGAPVVTSRTSSLPEIAGEGALFINPREVDSLVEAMTRLLSHPGLRETLKTAALKQSRKFSWKNTTEQILDIYHQVMENKPWFSNDYTARPLEHSNVTAKGNQKNRKNSS